MKKITALLTAAVMAVSCGFGSMPALAASADTQTASDSAVTVTTAESTLPEGAGAVSSDRIVTLDSGEVIVCPEGWDANDPDWVDAYLQMEDLTVQEDSSMLLMLKTFATYKTTTWAKNGGGTLTFYHDSSNYTDKNIVPVIDVSKYQPSIDWDKVKADGIDYAIIRVGYRGVNDGTLNEDAYYKQHIQDALAAGLQVGVYIYSQAITKNEAIAEANYVLERIDGLDIDLPVIMDYEYYTSGSGRLYNANLSKAKKTRIAKAFMQTVEAAGYDAMLYAGSSFLRGSMNGVNFSKSYPVWCARYYNYLYAASSTLSTSSLYQGEVEMWQCTSSAKVSGISGNVDFSYWYQDPNWTSGNTGKVFTERTPSVTTGTVSDSSITITWNKISGASQYQVFYSDSELGTYSSVMIDSDQTSYTLSGLNSGQEYYFQVRGVNSDGDTTNKSSILPAVTSGGKSITLKTTKNFWIRSAAGTSSSATKLLKLKKGTELSVDAITRNANGKTWYKVQYSSVTGYVPATAVKVTVKAATKLKQAGKSTNSLKITWSKSSDADQYKILRSTSYKGSYKVVGTVDSTDNTFKDTGLKAGTVYYYKVRAVKTVDGSKYKNVSVKISASTKSKKTITVQARTSAYIYKNADTSCKKLTTVTKGTKFKVTHTTKSKDGKKWYSVTYKKNGKTYKGYVRAKDMKKVS